MSGTLDPDLRDLRDLPDLSGIPDVCSPLMPGSFVFKSELLENVIFNIDIYLSKCHF